MTSLKLGAVQGRLTQSPPGQLQWFPQADWEAEFPLAKKLGLSYIEYIAERQHNASNPIWSGEGIERMRTLNDANGLVAEALCNDFVIDNCFDDPDVLAQNMALIDITAQLGCKKYVLPLFEVSELTLANAGRFKSPLLRIADKARECGIEVCLETILNGAELLEALDDFQHPALKVVFDTGNRIAFGHDLGADIRKLGAHINHVHIKDKNKANENVLVGTGLVNFHEVFKALEDISYDGAYTFETTRGNDPVRTMRHNIDFVDFFHQEAYGS